MSVSLGRSLSADTRGKYVIRSPLFRNIVPRVAMRGKPGDYPVLARRPRVSKTSSVLVPRRQRQRFRAEHEKGRRGVDGRLQAILLQRGPFSA